MRRFAFIFVAVAGVVIGATAFAQGEPAHVYVIVNALNDVDSLGRKAVADMYLKRTTFWPDGSPIEPVDLDPKTRTRRTFSAIILERSVASIRTYWQQRIFTGRGVPPPEVENDAQVVAYVASRRGAIGYVGRADVPGNVRVIRIR